MELGFAGPVPVLSAEQRLRFSFVLNDPHRRPPLDWPKGYAASTRAFYEIATLPSILSIVDEALGGNVLLWGVSILSQKPGEVHPWHSDIETSDPDGRTVSVWIGLENTRPESSIKFVERSHEFGATVQEIRHHEGLARQATSTETVLKWATARDPRAALAHPAVTDGEAIFFQGSVWHFSENRLQLPRLALLLQYAAPESRIRMPDANHLDWPFRLRDIPKPPCIMIRGSNHSDANRIVPAPVPVAMGTRTQLTNRIHPLSLPLAIDESAGFKPYDMFSGSTPDLREMDVHVSALGKGHCPHPPHTHRDEEILVMLRGEADLILPAVPGLYGDDRHPLKPGEFVYYPAHFPHTLRGTSAEPANYLMFKWHTEVGSAKAPLKFGHYSTNDPNAFGDASAGFRIKTIFEGATDCLRKLHAHLSVLEPGAGYEPHIDAYDVAILILDGEVETLGQRVGVGGTVFHPAGQTHGLRNPGAVRARYVVFEFHGSQSIRNDAFPKPPATLLQMLTDRKRWQRKAKKLTNALLRR